MQDSLPAVVIRADSGHEIGAGHIRRCLSLATLLKAHGFHPLFVCRTTARDISQDVECAGFDLVRLPENERFAFSVFSPDVSCMDFQRMAADAEESVQALAAAYPGLQVAWVITDHMLIRQPWQALFAERMSCKVFAIDGLANAAHQADILLDPQVAEDPEAKWSGLVPAHCTLYSGPSFLPLSEEFAAARRRAPVRSGVLTRVLVCFGGTDIEDLVCRTVRALLAAVDHQSGTSFDIDVAVPADFPSMVRLEQLLSGKPRVHLHAGLHDLSPLMLAADLAIGGGGIMLWERCLLGLPAIAVPLARNQEKPIAMLAARGAVMALKSTDANYERDLSNALLVCIQNPATVQAMSSRAFSVMTEWPQTESWLKILKGSVDERA